MLTKIYSNQDGQLYKGEVDMVMDKNGCIEFVSPWPKKFEVNPMEPMLHIRVKAGTTAEVVDGDGNEDPFVILTAPALEDSPIIQNMKDFWKHQAAQSEVS